MDIISLIDKIKKAEQLVDKMALIEHMDEVSRAEKGKTQLCLIMPQVGYDTDLSMCCSQTS
jgi:hypothetical protein